MNTNICAFYYHSNQLLFLHLFEICLSFGCTSCRLLTYMKLKKKKKKTHTHTSAHKQRKKSKTENLTLFFSYPTTYFFVYTCTLYNQFEGVSHFKQDSQFDVLWNKTTQKLIYHKPPCITFLHQVCLIVGLKQ